ncbi:MAG: transcription antitermination factor NusB [Pseudomonadota bacterium]
MMQSSDSVDRFDDRSNRNRRTTARLAAVQALYQMEQTGLGVDSVVLEFKTHRLGSDLDDHQLHDADDAFFENAVRGVVRIQHRLDPFIEKLLAKNWTLSRLNATARAILRSALFELINREDVPPKVVIDEYVEIAKAFFDVEESAFINAVLDSAARDIKLFD